jgi:peptidylprolyl isomerase
MKVELGHNVQVHYVGSHADGTEFDNSRVRGQPLTFKVGDHRMIRGFSSAIVGMNEGETKSFTIPPGEAYGERNELATRDVPIADFGEIEVEVGGMVKGNGPRGPFLAQVTAIENEVVTLDMNHPLAGKELNFEIEVVANTGVQVLVEDDSPEATDTVEDDSSEATDTEAEAAAEPETTE